MSDGGEGDCAREWVPRRLKAMRRSVAQHGGNDTLFTAGLARLRLPSAAVGRAGLAHVCDATAMNAAQAIPIVSSDDEQVASEAEDDFDEVRVASALSIAKRARTAAASRGDEGSSTARTNVLLSSKASARAECPIID